MGLETATYISDLDPTNPRGTDFLNQADDHMRLIKQVLQNSFINATYPIDFNAVTVWGQINGTLSDQTDLQNALDAKFDVAGGTVTGNLQVQGGFTSQGIDDNATDERLQLTNSAMTVGTSGSGTFFQILKPNGDGALYISGSSNAASGGNLELFGATHPTNPGDFNLRSGGGDVINWDESAGQLVLATGTGAKIPALTLDASRNATFAGNITSKGIDDNATVRTVNLSNDLLTQFGNLAYSSHNITGAGSNFILNLAGGSSGSNGGNISLYGSAEATRAGDVEIASGVNDFFVWDESDGALEILTGTGAKTLALTIDAFQGATFAQGAIWGGNNTNLVLLQRGSDSGSLGFMGGGSTFTSPYLELFGPSHATLAGDIAFRRNNSNNAGYWDESNTRWQFDGSEIRLGNFHFDADQVVGAAQDDYILKYDDATGLIGLEAPAAGGIGGTIADNEIAFGAATANTIEGNAQFTFDPTVTTGNMLYLNEGLTPPRTTGNLVRITAFNNGPTGDLVHIEQGAAVTNGSALKIRHGGNVRAVDIATSSSSGVGLYVETPSFASNYTSHFLAQGTSFGAAVFGEANSQIAHGGYFFKNVANPTGAVLRARSTSSSDSSATPVVLIENFSVNSGAEGIFLDMNGKGSGVAVYSGAIKVANNGGAQFSVDPLISTRLAANESTTVNSTAWLTPTGFNWYALPDGAYEVDVFLVVTVATGTVPGFQFQLTNGASYRAGFDGMFGYNGVGQTIGHQLLGWNNGSSWLGYQRDAVNGTDPVNVQQTSNLTLNLFSNVFWVIKLSYFINFTGSTPGSISFQVRNATAIAGINQTINEGSWFRVERIGG